MHLSSSKFVWRFLCFQGQRSAADGTRSHELRVVFPVNTRRLAVFAAGVYAGRLCWCTSRKVKCDGRPPCRAAQLLSLSQHLFKMLYRLLECHHDLRARLAHRECDAVAADVIVREVRRVSVSSIVLITSCVFYSCLKHVLAGACTLLCSPLCAHGLDGCGRDHHRRDRLRVLSCIEGCGCCFLAVRGSNPTGGSG